MKSLFTPVKVLAFFCAVIFALSACRKEPEPPAPPADIHWLLTGVDVSYFNYPPMDHFVQELHYFQYNSFRKPWVHIHRDTWGSGLVRTDTFFYDNAQRITEIRSVFWFGSNYMPIKHKKIIHYDAGGRKSGALKYILDTATHQYRVADSIVYAYQDSTIFKIVHHIWSSSTYKPDPAPGTIDTAYFVYNHQGNLVRARYGWNYITREFSRYDSMRNAYQSLGVEGLELEPRSQFEWDYFPDFALMMQMPRFSKNNYRTSRNPAGTGQTDYTITYGSADSMTASFKFISEDQGYERGQVFEYTPAN